MYPLANSLIVIKGAKLSMPMRPAWIEVDLNALAANTRTAKRLAGTAALFAVCKGDAYGCGAERVGRVMQEAGADAFAVADPEDALRLRAGGVDKPILLFAGTTPDQAECLAKLGIVLTVHDFEGLEALTSSGLHADVFVEIDCGYGRLGFVPADWARAFASLKAAPNTAVLGLYSHFSNPDSAATTARQAAVFAHAVEDARSAGLQPRYRMIASSRVLAAYPDLTLTAIEPGRLLYGVMEGDWAALVPQQPVIKAVKSRVIQVRDLPDDFGVGYGSAARRPAGRLRTAVAAFGFKDGIPTTLPAADVLIRGRRCPVLGSFSTEHAIIDVTQNPSVEVGDEVVFVGEQDGDQISFLDFCARNELSVLEMLQRFGRSLRRVYV